MKYMSLNDAAGHVGDKRLVRGPTRIWYVRPEHRRDYSGGYEWLKRQGIPVPDAKTIGQTHVKLGSIDSENLHEIYQLMQGEHWSPGGEANDLLTYLGLDHTSMMIGDIIQLPDGSLHMVDRAFNFARLGNPTRVRSEDLPAFLAAGRTELRSAQAAAPRDPARSVGSAVAAAYFAGAATYLARKEGLGSELQQAENTFMSAYAVAQRACGRTSNPCGCGARANNPCGCGARANNPCGCGGPPAQGIRKATKEAEEALERARNAKGAQAAHHALDSSRKAGVAWANGSKKGQRLLTEAEHIATQAATSPRLARATNPAVLRRRLLR